MIVGVGVVIGTCGEFLDLMIETTARTKSIILTSINLSLTQPHSTSV